MGGGGQFRGDPLNLESTYLTDCLYNFDNLTTYYCSATSMGPNQKDVLLSEFSNEPNSVHYYADFALRRQLCRHKKL